MDRLQGNFWKKGLLALSTPTMEKDQVSVIIPTYHHHDVTIAHVKLSMDVTHTPKEIIVVNDGGDPSLKEKLRGITKKCPVVYARVDKDILWNYNGACNLGWWLSTGEYLAFEDNDNFPSRTFYESAVKMFHDEPSVGRVYARKRKVITTEELFEKKREEWEPFQNMGPNMGTAMIKRSAYARIKGQDERFVGAYGYMYYDLKARLMGQAGYEFGSVDEYFYIREGQSDLDRARSGRNLNLYRENAKYNRIQHPKGIINFTYDYEVLA